MRNLRSANWREPSRTRSRLVFFWYVSRSQVISQLSESTGNLSSLVASSKALPSLAIPSNEPKSPEFSSNCHKQPPANAKESSKTPNVYINGLPPNFREDQLLAIAAPFGDVLSVRCFTRNTIKNPSGYGFVLYVSLLVYPQFLMCRRFKTIAAAEKCIVTLKRSDLHPSFSKVRLILSAQKMHLTLNEQVNKPPRVACAPISPMLPAPSSSSSSLGSDQDSSSSGELNFKTKMAQLEDKKSANVYIEGCVSLRLFY